MSTVTRRQKRGTVRFIYNDTFERDETYRRTSKGLWAMTDPSGRKDIPNAPLLTTHELDKLEADDE